MIIFGLIALLIVGASWCLVGMVLGRAPKDGIDAKIVQFTSGVVSILASLIISTFFVRQGPCSQHVLLSTCACYFLGGVFNYCGLQAMSAGMQRGPNGAVWGIMQSALIAPAIVGILFFNVAPTWPRMLGLVSLIVALVFYAMTKGGTAPKLGTGSWKFFAFVSFAVICVQQNLSTLPSYFEGARQVSPVIRSLAGALGSFLGAVTNIAISIARDRKQISVFNGMRNKRLWIYVFSMQFFSLIFAYTLLWPGIDILAKAGAGGLSYPIMVGSCIFSFSLYAIFGLKEKITTPQILALIFCAIGLAGLCFQSPKTEPDTKVRIWLNNTLFTDNQPSQTLSPEKGLD